jgi:hypothetical protein
MENITVQLNGNKIVGKTFRMSVTYVAGVPLIVAAVHAPKR